MSRNQKDLGKNFPEIVEAIGALDLQDAIVDGEIVAIDEKGRSSFQMLQGFDMGTERPPIVFYAFDLIRLNGRDLRNLPIEERKAQLRVLTTSARKPPLRSARFEAEIALLPFSPRRFGPVTRFVVAHEAF